MDHNDESPEVTVASYDFPNPGMQVMGWPLIVKVTETHVVWAHAEDRESARSMVEDEPHDFVDSESTLHDIDWTVDHPDEWDWDLVHTSGQTYDRQVGPKICDFCFHSDDHARHLRFATMSAAKAAERAGEPSDRSG